MEIGNLGSLYLDDARFAASSAGIGKNAMGDGLRRPGGTGGMPSFAELLEKSYGKPGGAEVSSPPAKSSSPPPSSLLTPHSPTVDKTDKLYEQCEALETFMVKILINGMRNTVQKSGLIDEGFAGKMYEDMLYDEYARDFTKNAGFGLAELAYLELTGQRGRVITKQA
ncbi:MAG: rod-binding protein [Treponema sp.]|jgi:flagellar protein FlgJ|nr:rod-binding protein [Treponema sp.]